MSNIVLSSKPRTTCTSSSTSPSSSGHSTPTRQLITGRICDPIELMANRLAEELALFAADQSQSDEDQFILCSVPQPYYREPASSRRSSSRRKPCSTPSSIKSRSRSGSLSTIPEVQDE